MPGSGLRRQLASDLWLTNIEAFPPHLVVIKDCPPGGVLLHLLVVQLKVARVEGAVHVVGLPVEDHLAKILNFAILKMFNF